MTNNIGSSSTSRGKVLVVLSGSHSIQLKTQNGDTIDQETGFFLKELAQPLILLLEANYEPVIATPDGKVPHLDPLSNSALWFLGNWFEKNRELDLVKSLEKEMNNPRTLASLTDEELASYSGILIPGGHGPMGDLGKDRNLGHILTTFHTAHKPTGVICHGPIALISTQLVMGGFAYKGYKVTCYANKEEMSNELLWGGKLITKVEDALREAGADVEVATIPLTPKVIVDRELVSGEGPSSAHQFGQEFVKLLNEKAQTTT